MPTSRDRVKAALTFNHPDRAPRDLWALPYISLFRQDEMDALLAEYPMDISGIQVSPGSSGEDAMRYAQPGTYTDEWGSIWHVAEAGVVGEVKGPVLDNWSKLAHFKAPWPLLENRDFSAVNRKCEQSECFIISECVARPFERMQFLRGSEDLYMDIAYGAPEFFQLRDMVHEYYLADMRAWCQTGVDAVMFMDDWGSNQSLLINPKTWRATFKPLYKDYVDLIHAAGKFAFFHSDGYIQAIYGDLVEIGVDAVNSQLFTMDIEEIARLYKGKITFWGEIDRQHVMPFGSQAEVKAAVQRVRSALDDGSGGLIAQCEWGKDNSAANVNMVYQAWLD